MDHVGKFRWRLIAENALFAALVIALIVFRPAWWVAVLGVALYIAAATVLHRLVPPPPPRPPAA
jgi:predicted cobalt transporter CbtA